MEDLEAWKKTKTRGPWHFSYEAVDRFRGCDTGDLPGELQHLRCVSVLLRQHWHMNHLDCENQTARLEPDADVIIRVADIVTFYSVEETGRDFQQAIST